MIPPSNEPTTGDERPSPTLSLLKPAPQVDSGPIPTTVLPSTSVTPTALVRPAGAALPATVTSSSLVPAPVPGRVAPASGDAIVRRFGGGLVDGDFLVNPMLLAEIVQYADGRIAIWQTGQLIAVFQPGQVLSLGYETRQSFVQVTPGWAIALGILGLLFFLIGVLFFLVKETRPVFVHVITLRLIDGRHLTLTQP